MLACLAGARASTSPGDETPLGRRRSIGTRRQVAARAAASCTTRLAGTTSRFITALAALGAGPYVIDGDAAVARPADGAAARRARRRSARRCTRRNVGAPAGHGQSARCAGGADVGIRGDVSSQFLTALMLIGPYVPGGLQIAITTPLVSRPYLQITKAVMADFGHDDVTIGDDDDRRRRRPSITGRDYSDRTRCQLGQLPACGCGDLRWTCRGSGSRPTHRCRATLRSATCWRRWVATATSRRTLDHRARATSTAWRRHRHGRHVGSRTDACCRRGLRHAHRRASAGSVSSAPRRAIGSVTCAPSLRRLGARRRPRPTTAW